jgi:hypothetical protein
MINSVNVSLNLLPQNIIIKLNTCTKLMEIKEILQKILDREF